MTPVRYPDLSGLPPRVQAAIRARFGAFVQIGDIGGAEVAYADLPAAYRARVGHPRAVALDVEPCGAQPVVFTWTEEEDEAARC